MDKDLIIAARPAGGFRRCGIHHPPEQVRHPAGTLDKAQVAALKAEPNLIVIEVEPETPAEDGKKAGASKTGAKQS